MDKIIIKGLKIFAYHGVNPEEKVEGQYFIIDTEAFCDLRNAGKSDNLDDTVSYAKIKKCIERVFTADKYDLIEKTAEIICESVLKEFPAIERIICTVKKPDAPMKGEFEYAGVTLDRSKSDV